MWSRHLWSLAALAAVTLAGPIHSKQHHPPHPGHNYPTTVHTIPWHSPSSYPHPPTYPGAQPTGKCPAPDGDATEVSIPNSAPDDAYQVPGDFVGFGFETAFLNNYGYGTFSENLVNSVAKRLGVPAIIRVGGTSGDRIVFNPNQQDATACISGDCPVGFSATYSLGPSYFEGFKRFANQHFSFQAPMGRDVNTTGSLDYTKRAYEAIGADRLAAISLGNEVDIYGGGYTLQEYVTDALALENAIEDALPLDPNERIFEVLDLSDNHPAGFSVKGAFKDGIDKNQRVKYAAAHWYQVPTTLSAFDPQTEQQYLMNHAAVVSKFASGGYLSDLQYIESQDPAVGYILAETGSSLAGPPKAFQDAFGAALWYVDFECYSMSLGVKRVDATGRPAAPHSMWVPDDSVSDPSLGTSQNIGPQVRGPYFAMPLLADFVGTDPGAVVAVLEDDYATAYAMYDASGSHVTRVALTNLKFWDQSVDGARGETTFQIPIPGEHGGEVSLKRLRSATGAYAQSYDVQGSDGIITYAGETWSYKLDNGEGSLVPGEPQVEKIEVCDGVATVVLQDSEAAILFV